MCQNSRSLRSGHKLRHTFLKCWKAKLHLKNIMNSILTMVLKFSNYAVPHFFLCLEYMMGMNDMIYQNQLSNNIKSVLSVFEKLVCTILWSFSTHWLFHHLEAVKVCLDLNCDRNYMFVRIICVVQKHQCILTVVEIFTSHSLE